MENDTFYALVIPPLRSESEMLFLYVKSTPAHKTNPNTWLNMDGTSASAVFMTESDPNVYFTEQLHVEWLVSIDNFGNSNSKVIK